MSEHPIGNLMTETMAKIKEMVDVNTIIGSPITARRRAHRWRSAAAAARA